MYNKTDLYSDEIRAIVQFAKEYSYEQNLADIYILLSFGGL